MAVRVSPIVSVGAPIERRLRGKPIQFGAPAPRLGERLHAEFSLPAVRSAREPLCAASLSRGLSIVTTLPNVEAHACAVQIVAVSEVGQRLFPDARIVLVASDPADRWRELDLYHPDVPTAGYTLDGASPDARAGFVDAFGVGVLGERRLGRGIFVLDAGTFVAVQIPDEQFGEPDVDEFLESAHRRIRPESAHQF